MDMNPQSRETLYRMHNSNAKHFFIMCISVFVGHYYLTDRLILKVYSLSHAAPWIGGKCSFKSLSRSLHRILSVHFIVKQWRLSLNGNPAVHCKELKKMHWLWIQLKYDSGHHSMAHHGITLLVRCKPSHKCQVPTKWCRPEV